MHICFLDIDGTLISTAGAGQAAFVVTLTKDFGIPNVTSQGVAFAGRSDRAIAQDLFKLYGIEPTPETWQRFPILQKPFSTRDIEQAIALVRRLS